MTSSCNALEQVQWNVNVNKHKGKNHDRLTLQGKGVAYIYITLMLLLVQRLSSALSQYQKKYLPPPKDQQVLQLHLV